MIGGQNRGIHHLLVRVYGCMLLFGAVFIGLSASRPLGYFSWTTLALGVPAGLGLVLYRKWGRVLGLLFSVVWLVFAIVLVAFGKGFTISNVVLLVAAVGGLWIVFQWE
jgi:hypothetical protein